MRKSKKTLLAFSVSALLVGSSVVVYGSSSSAEQRSAGETIGQTEVLAKSKGAGTFKIKYVPEGLTLVSESTADMSDTRVVDGRQESDSNRKRDGRVFHFSSLGSAERGAMPADTPQSVMDSVKDLYVVVIKSDPSVPPTAETSKRIQGSSKVPTTLRGRQGQRVSFPGTSALNWVERKGLEVQVTGYGVNDEDILKVAKSLDEVDS